MPLSFKELTYVIGSAGTVGQMHDVRPLHPFDDSVVDFLDDLSRELRGVRDYPDVATFGFWCRRAALLRERSRYDDVSERLGRGVVFHSTPSNVAVNFAFSFVVGLLAGNANIVRLPARPFEQVDIICAAVRELLKGRHADMAPYVAFVRYPPVREISDDFSAMCDVRVVWGGDVTVAEMRHSPLPSRSIEVTFADRHSIAVIDSDAYLAAENKNAIARGFYNDTYYTDQNACTSPRIVFWLGGRNEEARDDFWGRIHGLASEEYVLTAVQSVGKLNAAYLVASQRPVRLVETEDMYVTRVYVKDVDAGLMDYKYNSGFYFEKDIDSLDEIVGVCDLRCQTLTYFGVPKEELVAFIERTRPSGIDRCVPIGKSMDFTLVWDGYDLIRQLSRRITVL